MTTTSILLKIRIDPRGGYIVTDPNGSDHFVGDELSLGRRAAALLEDPAMPKLEEEKQDEAVGFVASIGRKVLPQHRGLVDAAEPLAHRLANIARSRAAQPRKRGRSVKEGS